MKKIVLFFLILMTINGSFSFGQKLKYDDIFYLLESKQYDKAEPFLKDFLKESRNNDHPNANFQLARIFDAKAMEADVFKEINVLLTYKDSASIYYDRAKEYIDDRETRRNDEYYEEFKKRDVRSGKVEVKTFDIHYFIDERKKILNIRVEGAERANDLYLNANKLYSNLKEAYINLIEDYKSENELLLRSNLTTIGSLEEISDTYNEFTEAFEKYKNTFREIPNSKYSPKLLEKEIHDINNDGKSVVDLIASDIEVWNYGGWSNSLIKLIKDEVMPIKSKLSEYDKKLEELYDKIMEDSTAYKDELESVKEAFDRSALLKYDDDPLPLKLFDLRIAELEYLLGYFSEHNLYDSMNIPRQYSIVNREVELMKNMDSIVTDISSLDIDTHMRNYKTFVDSRYGGYLGLDKYLKDKLGYAENVLEGYEEVLEKLSKRNAYMLAKSDTILIDTAAIDNKLGTSVPRIVHEDYALGIDTTGAKPMGYYIEINPARVTDTYYKFELDLPSLNGIKLLETPDPSGQVFYILFYNETEGESNEKFNLFLSKIYKVDGVNWTKSYKLPNPPNEVELLGSGDLNIYHGTEIFRLDKDGNHIDDGEG